MLGRQTPSGGQDPLAPQRNEAVIGYFVVVVQQPFDTRLFARMQLYPDFRNSGVTKLLTH